MTETRKDQFYKFLKEDKFVDVTLISEEGMEVKAHRMVLSSATAFFDNIFQICNNKSTENLVIFLYGIKFLQLKSIIEFVYLGETTVEEKNLNTFLLTAKLLKIEGLRKIDPVTSATVTTPSESVIKRNSEKTHGLKHKAKVQDHFNEELIKETNERHFNNGPCDFSTRTTTWHSSSNSTSTTYSSSRSDTTSPSLSQASSQSVGSQRESLEKLRESFDEYFEKKKNRGKIQTGNGKFSCRICEREDFASKKHLDFHSQTFHDKHFE